MSVESFQDLYDQFCDAAGTPGGKLEMNNEGTRVFSSEIDGVVINIVEPHHTQEDSAFVLVDFGPAPADRELEVLRALLATNFSLLGEETTSTFSLHPVFGNVTLQAVYPFRKRSGAQLLRSVKRLAAMAVDWRSTYFLPEATA